MRKLLTTISLAAALSLLIAASAGPTRAACPEPREFPVETLFVCTPGINDDCGAGWWHFHSFPYHGDESIFVEELRGAFWAMGSGNPLIGVGDDSGFWDVSEWAMVRSRVVCDPYLGCVRLTTPPTIEGDWTADPMVDGCIDDDDDACMMLMLADQHAGEGFFALLSAGGGTPFDLRGACQIGVPFSPDYCWAILAPIPAPRAGGMRRAGISIVKVNIDAPSMDDLAAGLYTDRRCDSDAVYGYNIYQYVGEEQGVPPKDRHIGADWALLNAEAIQPGTSTAVSISCRKRDAAYLAGSLVFESGFETPYLSADSEPINCGAPPRYAPGSQESPYRPWSPAGD
jgi:hypothetical protein